MDHVFTKMPKMIYGTAWKKGDTKRFVKEAIKQGFTGIDTACQPKHYNEGLVGEALCEVYAEGKQSRKDIYIQTKFTSVSGQDPQSIPYDPKLPLRDQVLQSFKV